MRCSRELNSIGMDIACYMQGEAMFRTLDTPFSMCLLWRWKFHVQLKSPWQSTFVVKLGILASWNHGRFALVTVQMHVGEGNAFSNKYL